MTYRSDRSIAEQLLPVRLVAAVLWFGLDDRESEDAKVLLGLIRQAENEILDGIDIKRAQKLLRRVWRISDAVLKPFHDAKAHVAKFGLVAYYVMQRLVENGRLEIVDGSAFDQVISALLSPDGTLTEFANIPKIDESAQKQARKMFATLKAEGLFVDEVWDA